MRRALGLLLAGGLLVQTPVIAQVPAPTTVPALYTARPAGPVVPGAWLGSEPLPEAVGLTAATRQIRFIYGSTDGVTDTAGTVVSGAVFFPGGTPPAGGWPIVAWAHGTVGIADHCAPSVAGRSDRDQAYLGAWLAAGYAVISSDYQGLGTPGPHPYLHNRAAAYNVLDAVRAARSALPDLGAKVLLVGQSQGAAAAIATAAHAPAYAPEIDVVGTIATGVPNVAASLSRANQAARDAEAFDPAVAYLMYLAASAAALDPSLDAASAVTPLGRQAFADADQLCAGPMLESVRAQGLTQLNAVTPAFVRVFSTAISALRYPALDLNDPLFVGAGADDVDTPAEGQLQIVEQACRAGSRVEAHVYAGRDHSSAVNPSFRQSVEFARKVMAGSAPDATCRPVLHPAEPDHE